MKTKIIQLLLIAFVVALSSCATNESTSSANERPQGMSAIDLSTYGKPFMMWVPDTNLSPLRIGEEGDGALLVQSGKNFAIRIYETPVDLQLKKDDIAADEVNRFSTYIKESADGFIWESTITEPQFHFVYNKNINGTEYGFADDPSFTYNKEAAELMYHCAENSYSASAE